MARYAKFFSVGAGGGGTNNLQLPIGTILDTTLRQVQDGTGTGSPLYLSTRRVGITSDSSVTTQVSSVIQATTTNANLVIAPNGTGALVASIPDGTATGGDARGVNAVDLQTSKNVNTQVASGQYSNISGGRGNTASNTYSVVGGGNMNNNSSLGGTIAGGRSNTNSAPSDATIGGGNSNTASSQYGVISGGQTNTASTGSYAIVVGGQSNTASGQASVVGGNFSQATNISTVALGGNCIASGLGAVALGRSCTANAESSVSIGYQNTASAKYSNSTGLGAVAYLQGMQAYSTSGGFVGNGEAQISNLVPLRSASLNSGATTVLSLDNTGVTNLIIPNGNNRLWAVKVVATAFVSVAGGTLVLGDSYMGEFTLLFKRVGGTSSVVGVSAGNIIYDTNMATAAFTFAAGASQDLQITFKAPTTASATTFRCVAKVELVEVAY